MLDDFSTELKRLGGGAALALETAQTYDAAHSAVSKKQQDRPAEVENARNPSQRPRSNGPRGIAERDCLDSDA